eukprot:7386261-Prymnesium_polylepis.3
MPRPAAAAASTPDAGHGEREGTSRGGAHEVGDFERDRFQLDRALAARRRLVVQPARAHLNRQPLAVDRLGGGGRLAVARIGVLNSPVHALQARELTMRQRHAHADGERRRAQYHHVRRFLRERSQVDARTADHFDARPVPLGQQSGRPVATSAAEQPAEPVLVRRAAERDGVRGQLPGRRQLEPLGPREQVPQLEPLCRGQRRPERRRLAPWRRLLPVDRGGRLELEPQLAEHHARRQVGARRAAVAHHAQPHTIALLGLVSDRWTRRLGVEREDAKRERVAASEMRRRAGRRADRRRRWR